VHTAGAICAGGSAAVWSENAFKPLGQLERYPGRVLAVEFGWSPAPATQSRKEPTAWPAFNRFSSLLFGQTTEMKRKLGQGS